MITNNHLTLNFQTGSDAPLETTLMLVLKRPELLEVLQHMYFAKVKGGCFRAWLREKASLNDSQVCLKHLRYLIYSWIAISIITIQGRSIRVTRSS